ncbi:2-oxoglutarate ferredoxin oxidoreductase subunit beta [Desulfatibacillum alkenivorans DSM 16219]|jgi:2-oxoglutarate ferredoxin oxidoreductase subunit beta|uniref:2-oxoglutarate ferredoxin oxidoreductase subunit beta n=1 Tax=Desulfatibacillum alkenivorans DSM 16219 TaxID=1121393 RepID=A0A1M6UZ39_9BACT|nr:thiamine pyrophosphate-dependent enzyme [Desulfatibacillum alkenivorans]SHK74355.1 2-oxoglutarate ferredoxin oxidoreductase subunit beta [Desulfatibacillum alkenivorans DSM 16219]
MSDNSNLFDIDVPSQWCPGCPNFTILETLKKSFTALGLKPQDICLVSGIGQAAKLPHYIKCNFFNGLHGRALPVATGVAAANPMLKTVVTTGDGDCYGEGGNHFLHAMRRNPDITLIVHNNEIYALTKGQASPTTRSGEVRALNPQGTTAPPFNPLAAAIISGCTFVARGFTGDSAQLAELFQAALTHEGLSLVDVVQPCITWKPHPLQWYKDRAKRLPDDHDPQDRASALAMAMEMEETFYTGLYYRADPSPAFAGSCHEQRAYLPMAEQQGLSLEKTRALLQ